MMDREISPHRFPAIIGVTLHSFPLQGVSMSVATGTKRSELTAYEKEQVRRIAAWKSQPPNPLTELWKRISIPVAHVVERLIPDSVVSSAIEKGYDASDLIAGQRDIMRRAGVRDLGELKNKPLEECDALAGRVGNSSQAIAAVEGAATGAGGVITTLLDVPLLFVLAVGTIRKIGHCYGYPLHHKDWHFVLGVLTAAMAGSLEVRRKRINQLRELEDLLVLETQEDVLTEEALSFLFQLEIFEDIPGVGAISGGALNWAFMRRVDETARMVFQERWLRDNGKVTQIAPAEVHVRHLAGGWTGALGRMAYSGFYGLGFGAALPVYAVGSLLRPLDGALFRGFRDRAAAAIEPAAQVADRTRGATVPSVNGHEAAPGLATG
jgi:hypothetical protein